MCVCARARVCVCVLREIQYFLYNAYLYVGVPGRQVFVQVKLD